MQMNRVLTVFSNELLKELDEKRGLISRSAWIRQAVTDSLASVAQQDKEPSTPNRGDVGSTPTRRAVEGSGGEPSGEATTSRKAPRSPQRANTPASVARSKTPKNPPPIIEDVGEDQEKATRKKAKACKHANKVRKLNRPFCQDCGDWI